MLKHDWFGIGFPDYEEHYIFCGRVILILLVLISSRNNDELVSRIILKVKKNFFEKYVHNDVLCARVLI